MWAAAVESLRIQYLEGDMTPMEPGHSTGWRNLPFLVIAQIMDGPVALSFRDMETRTVQPGEVFCIGPGLLHLLVNSGPGLNLSRWCHISVTVFGGMELSEIAEVPRIFRGAAANRIGDINAEFARMNAHPPVGFSAMVRRRALEWELVSVLLQGAKPRLAPDLWAELARLAPVIRYIEENLDRPLSREDLANYARLSPSRFGALFKEIFRVSPGHFVRAGQLRRAQQLLMASPLGVAEIALQCGYNDPFHFSRAFKKHVGMSPLIYRQAMRLSAFGGGAGGGKV